MAMWKDFVKAAQAPGFTPTPLYFSSTMPSSTRESVQNEWAMGSPMDSRVARQQGAIAKGMAKGLKEAVPGFVDFVVGNVSGLSNGAAKALSGGSFIDGYNESRDFVRKNMSDPIRRAEMFAGGNMVKKVLDSANQYHENNIESSLGSEYDDEGNITKNWSDYAGFKNGLSFGEDVASAISNLAATGPMYAKTPKLSGLSLGTQLGVGVYNNNQDSRRIDHKEEYLRKIEAEQRLRDAEDRANVEAISDEERERRMDEYIKLLESQIGKSAT